MIRKRSWYEVNYSWQGWFEFNGNQDNYYWSYNNSKQWKIEQLSSKNLGKLAEKILKNWEELKNQFDKLSFRFPSEDELTFLKWLSNNGSTAPPKVEQGISVILNNIVTTSDIRAFKLVSSGVGPHVTIKIDGLPLDHPCWFYLNFGDQPCWVDQIQDYILIKPEWFVKNDCEDNNKKIDLDKDIIILDKDSLQETADRFYSHRILHNYIVLDFAYNEKTKVVKIKLKDDVVMVPYVKGYYCNCIPIAGELKESEKPEPYAVLDPEVVAESERVVSSLKDLSRIWQDRFAKSVLISAPPGSGKDNFAKSIPFGSGRQTDNFLSISLASGEKDDLERQLFGVQRNDGSIERGFIDKASKSALFLDEVHHDDRPSNIRASLLRPLESGEYLPVGSNTIKHVNDVLFILATSTPIREYDEQINGTLAQIPPPDFWTRMTHLLSIKHPLDFSDRDLEESTRDDKCKNILKCFFRFFWWERVEKFFNCDPLWQSGKTNHSADLIKGQQIKNLLNESYVGKLSIEFSDSLMAIFKESNIGYQELSIRGIRSIVSQILSIDISDIVQGRTIDVNDDKRDKLIHVIRDILKIARLNK